MRALWGLSYPSFNPGARWGWLVNTAPWPLYHRERASVSTHCTGGWLDMVVNDFYPYFPYLLPDLGETRLKRAAHIAVETLWASWRSQHEDFSCGCELNYVYSCTVKPFDILKVKNAWVKSLYHVTEYICNLLLKEECVYCAVWTGFLNLI
jgi:hypothetical protein